MRAQAGLLARFAVSKANAESSNCATGTFQRLRQVSSEQLPAHVLVLQELGGMTCSKLGLERHESCWTLGVRLPDEIPWITAFEGHAALR